MGLIRRDALPQQFNLESNGVLFGTLTLTLTKKGKTLLGLSQAEPPTKVRRKKKKSSQFKIQAQELLVKANQLGKAYRAAKSKFHASHGRKVAGVRNCAFSASELQFLKKAVVIMQASDVTNYQTYIKAQILGLRFCNGGNGIFPRIQQLATDGAELRMLEYLKAEKDEKGEALDLDISAEERATPLTENMKYMQFREYVLEKTATREQALYVMTLQVHRTGKVKPYVTEYLGTLNQSE